MFIIHVGRRMTVIPIVGLSHGRLALSWPQDIFTWAFISMFLYAWPSDIVYEYMLAAYGRLRPFKRPPTAHLCLHYTLCVVA